MWPKNKKVLIVAEISANHRQNLARALALIRQAKYAGADAVKFQAYTPDSLTIDSDTKYFRVHHPAWGVQRLYQLYQKAYTPWSWFKRLRDAAQAEKLLFFATAFDKDSVDLLEGLSVPFHKIASFELVDLPLIEYAAKTGKPLILSTGMATVKEIKEAVSVAQKAGAREVILLKCVSSYPARPQDMNLAAIPDMAKKFGCLVGVSDHTMGNEVPVAAVALGARIIEKHFTDSRKIKSPDSFFSIEREEFKALVRQVRTVEQAIGRVQYGPSGDERRNKVFRRSLFVVKDMSKGERFTPENIRSIRPASGLAPRLYDRIIGRKATKDLKRGTPLTNKVVR